MKATCSSETSVGTQRTAQRYITEDGTLHNHRCENLKSYLHILKSFIYKYCKVSCNILSPPEDYHL
jgi:hypothetical protein